MVADPGTSLVVVNATGTQVSTAPSVVDIMNPTHISVALPAGLPAGTYSVHWNTVATDGDAANGTWTFTYAPAQATATASPSATPAGTATVVPTTAATQAPSVVVTPAAPKTGMGATADSGSRSAAALLLLGTLVLSFGARAVVRPAQGR
jgi:hypothetical protein